VAHAAKVPPLSVARPESSELSALNGSSDAAPLADRPVPRRNFADRIDNGDDGPPIP
jgi:hypothetical protein